MQELKNRVYEVINDLNQNWVKELKDAEKENRGIDITEMFGKFSENMKILEKHFRDAEMRITVKKKGLFGR